MKILARLAVAAALAVLPLMARADDLVARGHYLSLAADCMPCHTKPGGTPFAGGLSIGTPFGSLSSPNITPDADTGIGGWSEQQFYEAVHDGIGKGGEYLYPVMPFTSYTKMPRADVAAIYAYLKSLKPVYAPRAPSHMEFPFDVRTGMIAWRELFFHPGTFVADPKESSVWNRGAYLVQGPEHCGECHSPRNILGATETDDSLAGGLVGHWLAPNISSDPKWGLGDWTLDQIVTFLKTGVTKTKGVAFGPMAEVVHDSLSKLTDADLTAIATYLKSTANRAAPPQPLLATRPDLVNGQTVYMDNCEQCHQSKGVGIPGAIPNLAGNRAVQAAKPNDVILAVLRGISPDGHYGAMPSFAGALSDQSVANVVNYVRSGWGNQGPTDASAAIVASMRSVVGGGLAGTQAARAFDCPLVGSAPVPGALADPAQVAFLANAQGMDLSNKIDELIADIQKKPARHRRCRADRQHECRLLPDHRPADRTVLRAEAGEAGDVQQPVAGAHRGGGHAERARRACSGHRAADAFGGAAGGYGRPDSQPAAAAMDGRHDRQGGWGEVIEVRQTRVFRAWLGKLADRDAVKRIQQRIIRLRNGLFGDVKPVGEGVSELRVDHGPGYRVYFVRRGQLVLVLLCGGDKSSQSRDIRTAIAMAAELKGRDDDP